MTPQPTGTLPRGFEDLEPFVSDWSLSRASDRINKRWTSSMDDIRSFYDVMSKRVDAVLDHLDTFDVDALPEPEQRLFYLVLSLAEAAASVEVYGQPTVRNAFVPARYVQTE